MSTELIVAAGVVVTLVGLLIVATATVLIVRAVMSTVAAGHKLPRHLLKEIAEIARVLRGGRSHRR
ncbi:hypothetical protein ACFYRY_30725 [Streptomyces sp. NPDC005263]|uniref:hypothetical protein n=1 Tax=Streptomyces sp. NPDC005263 TaxID=3364711 RepID=UPI0036C81379